MSQQVKVASFWNFMAISLTNDEYIRMTNKALKVYIKKGIYCIEFPVLKTKCSSSQKGGG